MASSRSNLLLRHLISWWHSLVSPHSLDHSQLPLPRSRPPSSHFRRHKPNCEVEPNLTLRLWPVASKLTCPTTFSFLNLSYFGRRLDRTRDSASWNVSSTVSTLLSLSYALRWICLQEHFFVNCSQGLTKKHAEESVRGVGRCFILS